MEQSDESYDKSQNKCKNNILGLLFGLAIIIGLAYLFYKWYKDKDKSKLEVETPLTLINNRNRLAGVGTTLTSTTTYGLGRTINIKPNVDHGMTTEVNNTTSTAQDATAATTKTEAATATATTTEHKVLTPQTVTDIAPLGENCVPIGDLLTNQLRSIVPFLVNQELNKLGPINYSFTESQLTIGFSTSSAIAMTDIVFNPIESKVCDNGTNVYLVADIKMEIQGAKVKLFAEEDLRKVLINGQVRMNLSIPTPQTIKLLSLKFDKINIQSPSREDMTWLLSLVTPSLTNYINERLSSDLLTNSPPIPMLRGDQLKTQVLTVGKTATASQQDITKAMEEFITRQLNALISSDFLWQQFFKICKDCPDSNIHNLNLGKTVWISDDGCAGPKILDNCIGCSWAYDIGIETIRGLGTLEIKSLKLGGLVRPSPTSDKLRFYFNLQLYAPEIVLVATLLLKPCTGSMIGFRRGVFDGGSAMLNLFDAYVEGTYNEQTKIATFNSRDIHLTNLQLLIHISTDWVKISTGNAAVDAIIEPIVNAAIYPFKGLVNVFELAMNKIIQNYLNDTLKDVLSGLIDKIPQFNIMIPVESV